MCNFFSFLVTLSNNEIGIWWTDTDHHFHIAERISGAFFDPPLVWQFAKFEVNKYGEVTYEGPEDTMPDWVSDYFAEIESRGRWLRSQVEPHHEKMLGEIKECDIHFEALEDEVWDDIVSHEEKVRERIRKLETKLIGASQEDYNAIQKRISRLREYCRNLQYSEQYAARLFEVEKARTAAYLRVMRRYKNSIKHLPGFVG